MPFEEIPSTPAADELVDRAFSRAARTGRAKRGVDAQASMLNVATNVLADNLEHVSRTWPDIDGLHPFHRAIAEAIVDVDALKSDLASVNWAAGKVRAIGAEYRPRMRRDGETASQFRKQAFARMADVLDEVADPLSS
ncbi:MAG: GTP-binding protein, partial [Halobacteriota archaeon]